MYRQGLGDCFLISVLHPPAKDFHLMIDCGVILGTHDAGARLRAVIADIIRTTGGKIDVLAVTHEHYDHVAGFVLASDLFVGPNEPADAGKLRVDEVWFAWTEDPKDKLAQKLRKSRADRVAALSALVQRMDGMGATERLPEAVDALRFFGVGSNGKKVGDTAQAMINAKGFAPKVSYRKPGEKIDLPHAAAVTFYVLGPPKDEKSLKKTDSTTEVYHLGLDALSDAVLAAAGPDADGTGSDAYAPFDRAYVRQLDRIRRGEGDDQGAAFIREMYIGPAKPMADTDVSWRQIEDDWLGGAETLGLALDSATNNTSLVLAIEVKASKQVLLFPADAQVGNWLSWQNVEWDHVTTDDLLRRTVFYKVGHHGSHNATLKQHGLERMTNLGVAFIPVDHEMAVKKRWGKMPLEGLVAALKQHCGDRVIRVDEKPVAGLEGIAVGPNGPALPSGAFGPLYYDWTLAL
jgi:hypothetical protein